MKSASFASVSHFTPASRRCPSTSQIQLGEQESAQKPFFGCLQLASSIQLGSPGTSRRRHVPSRRHHVPSHPSRTHARSYGIDSIVDVTSIRGPSLDHRYHAIKLETDRLSKEITRLQGKIKGDDTVTEEEQDMDRAYKATIQTLSEEKERVSTWGIIIYDEGKGVHYHITRWHSENERSRITLDGGRLARNRAIAEREEAPIRGKWQQEPLNDVSYMEKFERRQSRRIPEDSWQEFEFGPRAGLESSAVARLSQSSRWYAASFPLHGTVHDIVD